MKPFKIERYFAKYEFSAKYLLSCSDCESLTLPELLALASPQDRDRFESLHLGYTESPGLPDLREAIAGRYETASGDDVLIMTPEEGIYVTMRALLQPGQDVICVYPAYQSLYEVAADKGCRIIQWPIYKDGGRWQIDIDFLRDHVSANTGMIIINFPHNPTGFMPDHSQFQAIIDIARENNLYLFSDEMYRLLEHNPDGRLPAMVDSYEKGISLSGLSKAYSLPGLRIGWVALKDSEARRCILGYKDYTTICNNAAGEILALIAIKNADKLVQDNRNLLAENLRLAEAFFQRYANIFEWLPPLGSPVTFPRLLLETSVDDWCRHIVESQSIMVLPGSVYDFPGQHFRIGLGRRNFPESLAQLDSYLQGPGG